MAAEPAMAIAPGSAVACYRPSSATNVGADEACQKRRSAVEEYAVRTHPALPPSRQVNSEDRRYVGPGIPGIHAAFGGAYGQEPAARTWAMPRKCWRARQRRSSPLERAQSIPPQVDGLVIGAAIGCPASSTARRPRWPTPSVPGGRRRRPCTFWAGLGRRRAGHTSITGGQSLSCTIPDASVVLES
jgi:hypothetical protein